MYFDTLLEHYNFTLNDDIATNKLSFLIFLYVDNLLHK